MKKFIRIFFAIAIVVLLGVTLVHVVKKRQKSNSKSEEVNTEFKEETGILPVISVVASDTEAGSLHGYTTDMDITKMHGNLIVVDDTKKFKVKVDTEGVEINKIHADIVSFDGNTHILNTEVNDYKEKKNKLSFELEFPAEGKEDTEWMLIISIDTKDNTAKYYSRIMYAKDNHIAEQVEFVNFFSETTLDYEKAASWTDGIIGYLETEDGYENSNLGLVTIKSSFYQVTWGDMEIERLTDPTVTILEMDGDVGAYKLTYTVKSVNEYEQEEYYNITEYFRVWSALNTNYLRSYNRTMEQVFEASSATVTATRINLGIRENMDFDYVSSDNMKYIAFVHGDSLWCVNTDDYAVTKCYAIERNVGDNIKDSEIKVMSVDDDGNVEFIVYGYLNSIDHMGKNGIVAYSYTESSGITRERLFFEYDKPCEILANEVGTLYYIADGVLYIYIDSTINYVNLSTKEHGQIVTDLKYGTFAVNKTMDMIAYNTNGTKESSDSITIMNFATGEVKVVEAPEGEKISVCEYTGDNLIYGMADESEIKVSKNGVVTFPIKDLYIIDREYHALQRYNPDNYRVVGVEVKDNMINLKRTKKGKETTDDQLFDTQEESAAVASLSYIVTDLKETMPVLVFTYQLDTKEKIVLKAAKMYDPKTDEDSSSETESSSESDEDGKVSSKRDTFGGETELDLDIPKRETQFYYLYLNGKLSDIYTTKKDATKIAKEKYGYVVDEGGNKVYAYIEELQYNN